MRKLLQAFGKDQAGATAIEYSLIAAFIAIAIVNVLASVGTEVQGPFKDAATGLKKRAAAGA